MKLGHFSCSYGWNLWTLWSCFPIKVKKGVMRLHVWSLRRLSTSKQPETQKHFAKSWCKKSVVIFSKFSMETILGFYWVSWFSYFEAPQRSPMNPHAIPKATHLLGARPNGSCRNAQAAWHFIVTSVMARKVRKSVGSNKNSSDAIHRGPIISMIPSCRTNRLKSPRILWMSCFSGNLKPSTLIPSRPTSLAPSVSTMLPHTGTTGKRPHTGSSSGDTASKERSRM